MKLTKTCLVVGLVAVCVAGARAPLRAQSPAATGGSPPHQAQLQAAPTVAGGDDRPWNCGVPVQTREAARQLFVEGNRRFWIPLFAQATEQYRAALARWPHPAFHFNLALAQLNLGDLVDARASLAHAIAYGPEPLGAEQVQEAEDQLRDPERKLGQIEVSCRPHGAEVTLDGGPLVIGPHGFRGWATAGSHELTAHKPGYLAEARRVTVSSGQILELDLTLITLSEAADRGRRWATWKPWLAVGAGVTVVAAGGVLHALSSRGFNAYDDAFQQQPCARAHGCTSAEIGPALSDRLSSARREQQIAVAGYTAGGALLVAGAVLLYLNRPQLAEQATPSSPVKTVAVTPAISADMVGVVVSVSH